MSDSQFPVVTEGAIGAATVQTVHARDLHRFIANRDHFSTWSKDRVKQYGFVEGTDFVSFSENSEKGAPRIEYAITLDMAKELAMVERNEQGKRARQYFIECERRAKGGVDPAAILNDPASMRGLLLNYTEKVIELQGQVEEMRPPSPTTAISRTLSLRHASTKGSSHAGSDRGSRRRMRGAKDMADID
ncbi:antA/AntB antirepressor family protein [Chelatococcus asaccharovorans]|nr:antA/AntB antirepressor family protein [Chelatococcus asaccharovorans]